MPRINRPEIISVGDLGLEIGDGAISNLPSQKSEILDTHLLNHSDTFLGCWLVREYVYNPDGRFAGTVWQRRELVRLANGRIRVTQHCQPDPELAGHEMARFTGSPVFELSVQSPYRHYHGPAVVGTAVSWGDNAMTGRGLWPDFGHNFRSFAILASPERQLTGGKFFNASEMVANVVGVAVPDTASGEWPMLEGPQWPGDVATEWMGTVRTFSPEGVLLRERPLHRHYGPDLQWQDTMGDELSAHWQLSPQDQSLSVSGQQNGTPLQGRGKQFGWLLEIEAVFGLDGIVEMMELLDGRGGHLVGIRRWLVHQQVKEIELIHLWQKNVSE